MGNSRVEEALKRRVNPGAQHVLHSLEPGQLAEVWDAIKDLSSEEQDNARQALFVEKSWLRITVSRIAEKEIEEAEDASQVYALSPEVYTKLSDAEKEEQDNKRNRARRKALFPLIVRSVVKAEELRDDNWVNLEPKKAREYLEGVTTSQQRFLINLYLSVAAKDMEAAAKDPDYFRRRVPGGAA